ncbi:hypothetical protein GMST_36860 [Geomonas silvestris]|uniref:Uncharacterized protein n=1 Tax=Geomonas silvestris TaxID=2740184 RepID=A0A6V8MN15_9BACT|nr:hypothetical protein [Geomonas silvestris]GFO61361.1 hypothetical protein GMST_36860 [Geomonas silvestris]
MKLKKIALVLLVQLFCSAVAYAQADPTLEETARYLESTMAGGTSEARKESYRYVRVDACSMTYNVLGTYPSGGAYDITYQDLDFSALEPGESRFGHDYTSFVMLYFNKPVRYQQRGQELKIRTVVVNVSDDERAGQLFAAFLRLARLCSAGKNSLP